MSTIVEMDCPCPTATDGEIAAINLESARRRAWARFAQDPRRPGVAEVVVDNERLAAQFLGDLDALDRLEELASELSQLHRPDTGTRIREAVVENSAEGSNEAPPPDRPTTAKESSLMTTFTIMAAGLASAANNSNLCRGRFSTSSAKTGLLGMTAAAVMALSVAAGLAEAAPAEPVKNIVLVHGAFADGSSWAKVIPLLQAKGYHVTAVQNPLTSLADDVAATERVLAQQDGPVILVGHSWAGVVITEAGADPKVAGLVYVAAFGPDQGEKVGELGKAYPPPPALANPIVDKQGFMTLPPEAFRHFGSDLPAAEAQVAAATQGPIHASAFDAQVSKVAWKTKPSWYIVSKRDEAIAPDEERFFAKRMKATTTELNTSHVPMLSQPKDVAAVIMDAAAKASH